MNRSLSALVVAAGIAGSTLFGATAASAAEGDHTPDGVIGCQNAFAHALEHLIEAPQAYTAIKNAC